MRRGIRIRHSVLCENRYDYTQECKACDAKYEAWVYSSAEKKKVYGSFESLNAAENWREHQKSLIVKTKNWGPGNWFKADHRPHYPHKRNHFTVERHHYPEEPGCGGVYFVQGIWGGPIKIGYSKYPAEGRLPALQTGSPIPLRVLATVTGAMETLEAALHRWLEEDRLHGEWFSPSERLMHFLRTSPAVTFECQELESQTLKVSREACM